MTQDKLLADTILKLTTARGADKTICPSAVARHLAGSNEVKWRSMMAPIRKQALELAHDGKIVIKKGGVPVDLETFSGIYRIAIAKE